MSKVTNLTRETLSFITGVKDGAAVTESLKAGETRDLEIDLNDAQVQGRILSGVIAVESGAAAAPSAKRAAAPASGERRTAPTLGGDRPIRD